MHKPSDDPCFDLLYAYGQGTLRYHACRGTVPRSASGLSAPLEALLRFVTATSSFGNLSGEDAEKLRRKLEEGKGPWLRRAPAALAPRAPPQG